MGDSNKTNQRSEYRPLICFIRISPVFFSDLFYLNHPCVHSSDLFYQNHPCVHDSEKNKLEENTRVILIKQIRGVNTAVILIKQIRGVNTGANLIKQIRGVNTGVSLICFI
jgi:hypothetical protein